MSRRVHTLWALLTSATIALSGCHPTQPFYFHDDGDLDHYVKEATRIEVPDVCTETLDEVTHAAPPITPENAPTNFWDLTLEEAVRISMENSKVVRALGTGFQESGQLAQRIFANPIDRVLRGGGQGATTVYDVAIREADPRAGAGGVEAALSEFDVRWQTTMEWQRNDRLQNVSDTVNNQITARFFNQDIGAFRTELTKSTATNAEFFLRHDVNYEFSNNRSRLIPSDYTVDLVAGFRQPLLAGGGAQYTRIAGPDRDGSIDRDGLRRPDAIDGVMIARVRIDQQLADFEIAVRDSVSEMENAYWDLYFAYRNLETAKTGRAAALQTWKKVKALYDVGQKGGEAEKEAQAREQFFNFESLVKSAVWSLYREESRLRYLMGLAATDGRFIRPADEPTTAKVSFDWATSQCEGLARSPELRRMKWELKQHELELIAARNLLLPSLDATGRYRWSGIGDDLIRDEAITVPADQLNGTNAYQSLASGRFADWQLGLELTMPLGFRKQLGAVRHYELQVARSRAIIQDGELELSHQLQDAIRTMESSYDLTESNLSRRRAAVDQVKAVEEAYKVEQATLDLLLDAQRRQAESEIAYYRSLVDYNRAIMQVHVRKGSGLDYMNVYLAEGPWPAKAQFDAYRLARRRDSSYYLNYGFTRPKVVSQGPYLQQSEEGQAPENDGSGQMELQPTPADSAPGVETVPVPEPEPAPGAQAVNRGRASAASAARPGGARSFRGSSQPLTRADRQPALAAPTGRSVARRAAYADSQSSRSTPQ